MPADLAALRAQLALDLATSFSNPLSASRWLGEALGLPGPADLQELTPEQIQAGIDALARAGDRAVQVQERRAGTARGQA
jgi:hypothetical protein